MKGRQLLELLALSHGASVEKETLADQLWNGSPPPRWTPALECHVSVLRRRLAAAGLVGAVVTVSHGYLLDHAVGVDLTRARRELAEARRDPGRAALRPDLWGPPSPGSLLASSTLAPFAGPARAVLAEELAATGLVVAEAALRLNRAATAVDLARRTEALTPWCEQTQQLLLRAMSLQGDRAGALTLFADFRDRLHRDLGVEPGAALYAEYLAVLAQDAPCVAAAPFERRLLHRLLAQTA
ncbi:AfsR/SARP family transcriptional regulator [Nocardioides sp. AX2bis]|uniref:AfsR/SARP family transcriptional regulator n=1 Tax=Nocardioides sp. AX2bis TaxID=2653157 RepID=UPI00135C9314|nr:BTAD domain-containing putative transcriptional regulator [Nocardioides sp. AX2bis]